MKRYSTKAKKWSVLQSKWLGKCRDIEVPSPILPRISEQKLEGAQGSAQFDSIWSESYFSVQWVPACSHSMQGQDSFLSKDMAEISSHPLLQHGSVQVTVNYICFHFTATVVQEQKLPYGAATSKASSCPWKSMCCK